jgi:hypothetical protein
MESRLWVNDSQNRVYSITPVYPYLSERDQQTGNG